MNKVRKEDIEHIIYENLPWENLADKTVLISGAGGFIPSYVTDTLLALGNVKVIGLVRNLEKVHKKFPYWKNCTRLKLIEQDISEPFDINDKVDYIIHAASHASPKYYGTNPVGVLKANTLGTSYLLDIAVKNQVRKFLFFSSGEVYGEINENTPELTEDYAGKIAITNVRSCYGESKRMGENMCVCYSHQYNLPVNMIRLSHTYGPGVELNDGRCFGDFVCDILHNRNIVLNSDGSAKRSFLYITDMVVAMFKVLFFGEDKNAYNIAANCETSILELAQALISLYPEKHLAVEFKKDEFCQGYIKSPSSRSNFNTDKIKSLNWRAKIDIKTGFKRMIESYNNKET